MFENVKIIASDLDGTLLTSEKEVSSKTKESIEACLDKGAIFVPCTGRAYKAIDESLRKNDRIRYYVSTNGAIVYDKKNKQILRNCGIKYTTLLEINQLLSKDASLEVIQGGKIIVSELIDIYDYKVDSYYKYHYYQTRNKVDDLLGDVYKSKKPIEKIQIICRHQEETTYLLEEIAKNEELCVCKGPCKSLEITDKHATKGDGLKFLCDYLGISHDELLCFGDQANDMSMTKYFKHSVAMENAIDELKTHATYVTDTNDNDGVAKMMDKWLESHI